MSTTAVNGTQVGREAANDQFSFFTQNYEPAQMQQQPQFNSAQLLLVLMSRLNQMEERLQQQEEVMGSYKQEKRAIMIYLARMQQELTQLREYQRADRSLIVQTQGRLASQQARRA